MPQSQYTIKVIFPSRKYFVCEPFAWSPEDAVNMSLANCYEEHRDFAAEKTGKNKKWREEFPNWHLDPIYFASEPDRDIVQASARAKIAVDAGYTAEIIPWERRFKNGVKQRI